MEANAITYLAVWMYVHALFISSVYTLAGHMYKRNNGTSNEPFSCPGKAMRVPSVSFCTMKAMEVDVKSFGYDESTRTCSLCMANSYEDIVTFHFSSLFIKGKFTYSILIVSPLLYTQLAD